jgi:trans-aconitate methyltransferase
VNREQCWNPERYAEQAGFVAELGLPVVGLLAPRPGERILDLGCGDGALTEKLVAAGCQVVGVDASAEQVAAARARGLDAHVADANTLHFDSEFDAVFSNAALHWMKQPRDVIAGVQRALRPGGRFVGEFGGHGNVAAIQTALLRALSERGIDGRAHHPWYFPTDDDYRSELEAEGLEVETIALIPRPTPLPTSMGDWLEIFAGPFMAELPEDERPGFLAEVCEMLRPALCDSRGRWTADYVRLRFAARVP